MARIPTREEIEFYLQTHDLYRTTPCTLKENRSKIKNPEEPGKDLYCWKGIIRQQPDCVVGSVCDPYSYTNARTRFCLTWGCSPHLYVANEGTEDSGLTVLNERGGTVVYNSKKECEGAFISKINCFISGLRQSLDFALDPNNKKQLLIKLTIWFGLLIAGIIAYRIALAKYPQKMGRLKDFTGNIRAKGISRR